MVIGFLIGVVLALCYYLALSIRKRLDDRAGAFDTPKTILHDDEHIYVADTGNDRVQRVPGKIYYEPREG